MLVDDELRPATLRGIPRAEYDRIATERDLAKKRAFEAESALRVAGERATEAYALIRALWAVYSATVDEPDPNIEERTRSFLDLS